MEEEIKSLENFIITQIIANESFTFSFDYIVKKYKIYIRGKYKEEHLCNRSEKRKIKRDIEKSLIRFKIVAERYLEATNQMLKHFDNWEHSDNYNEKVDKVYKVLD